jgi:predicted site-specific integrase-resolvase
MMCDMPCVETQSDLIGSTESCRILKIHPATLGRWVKTGKITPAHKLPTKNGAYLFRRADIEALAAAS